MNKKLILLAPLFASACQVEQPPANVDRGEIAAPAGASNGAAPPAPDNVIPPASSTPAPAMPAPAPKPTGQPPAPAPIADPVPPTPDSEKSVAAAKQVIDAYFAALATRRYGDAYRLWGGNGAGMSQAAFAASFAKYKTYHGTAFKPGEAEGGAGSIYIEFPVTVTGVLTRGGGFVLEGPMTLRRVNDVDGSTAAQRRWHIASSGLKPRP